MAVLERGPDGGPSRPVRVELSDFHVVAKQFVDAQNSLDHIRQDLLDHLDQAVGAAGASDGAHKYQDGWAAALDCILNDGFRTAFDLLGAIGKGIDVSALNHATADQNSVPGKPGGTQPWNPVSPNPWPGNADFVTLNGDSPWWMPDFLEKYIPTADTGRIDAAAQACRDAAAAIRALVGDLHSRLQGLVGNNSSDDLVELEQFWLRAAGEHSILTGLPQTLDDVANSLVDFRIWNNDTQDKIKEKIKSIVDDLSIVGLVLAIGSVLTDGGLDVLIVGVIEALDLFGVEAGATLAIPIAEVAATAEAILITAGGAVAITQGVVPAMQAAMSGTPNPEVEGVDAGKISDEISGHTEPSRAPDPNATPGGHPTNIPKGADPETARSLQRENESATTLSRAGYDVEQNPSTLPNGRNPDYRVDGKVFDNYAPSTGRARNIADEMAKKVQKEQTDRIVLNLADSSVDLNAMRAQLHDWPIDGLKEAIAIDKQGNILHLYP
ncbi:CdiA C-terminal domain-containing protein [Amycolatopsis sp. NPDC004378]